jgi:hypothetical protein
MKRLKLYAAVVLTCVILEAPILYKITATESNGFYDFLALASAAIHFIVFITFMFELVKEAFYGED